LFLADITCAFLDHMCAMTCAPGGERDFAKPPDALLLLGYRFAAVCCALCYSLQSCELVRVSARNPLLAPLRCALPLRDFANVTIAVTGYKDGAGWALLPTLPRSLTGKRGVAVSHDVLSNNLATVLALAGDSL
jgi:hypothetical protein